VAAAAILGLVSAAGCGGGGDVGAESDLALEQFEVRAREAVGELRASLSAELKAALEQGPKQGIAVCRIKAPEIADVAQPEGLRIGRSSHRVRNPENAPEAWMLPLIEEFRSAGPDAAPRALRLEDGGLAYAEPIYMKPLCTVCHGESLSPAVQEMLSDLYPGDQAVGFRPDELRGIFWAVAAPDTPAEG
jgi:hypothetical protein